MWRGTEFLCAWLLLGSLAAAHDGGFGHSRRTIAVFADAAGWTIEYRLTLNPDEALLELAGMDSNGDGQISAIMRDQFCAGRARALLQRLALTGSTNVPLRYEGCSWGPALTQTYRFRAETAEAALMLTDDNFTYKPGLVRLAAGPGVSLNVEKQADLTHAERVRIQISRAAR